jgi:hypothetical protein
MASDESSGAKRAVDPTTQTAPAGSSSSDGSSENAHRIAGGSALTEDAALALLHRPDTPAEVLEQISKNSSVLKQRKVKLALVEHPRTPRHVSLPLVRQLYTFDLMQVALTPIVPADVKLAADEALCNRIETISSGEKLSLAHRGSNRIAGALLADAEARVVHAALQNSRLTEAAILKALSRHDSSSILVEAVCHHPQWSLRREVRMALLRNEKTPLARAADFARGLPGALLREILQNSRLPANVKSYLLKDLENRGSGKHG